MQGRRYGILDGVRGFTVLSMVLYHACWDLVHLAGRPWDWFQGTGAYVWQQSICWVFIFLAGLCFNLGRRHVRRGLELLSLGAVITGLTWLCLPRDAIFFGILFFLGAATLITVCLKPLLVKLPAVPGLGLSALLFVVLRNVNSGTWVLRPGSGCPCRRPGMSWVMLGPFWVLQRPGFAPRIISRCCPGSFCI
jgi:uncharacterized membrane protein